MDRYSSLRQGLVGAWCPSLSGSGYTLPDLSNYRSNGTLTNMSGGNNWVGGPYGRALAFDGVDDYVAMTLPGIVCGNFSIHGWGVFRTLNKDWAGLVMGRTGTENIGIFRGGNTSNLVSMWNGTINEYSSNTGLTITAGKWFRFAMIARQFEGTVTTWMDRASFSAGTSFFTTKNIGGAWNFGRDNNSTRCADCVLDDVRIYNRALTNSEMALLFQGPRVGLVPQRHRRGILPTGSTFHLNVGGTWKKATPWINVGGTWRQATPKIRVSGAYK